MGRCGRKGWYSTGLALFLSCMLGPSQGIHSVPRSIDNAFHYFDMVLAIAMPDRAPRMKKLYENLNIPHGTIVDPFRKPAMDAKDWPELDDIKEFLSERLILEHTSGEIAISASHRKVGFICVVTSYKKIVAKGFAGVFEQSKCSDCSDI